MPAGSLRPRPATGSTRRVHRTSSTALCEQTLSAAQHDSGLISMIATESVAGSDPGDQPDTGCDLGEHVCGHTAGWVRVKELATNGPELGYHCD